VSDIIAITITGILVGCLYGLIALGLVLIFKTTQVFNLAQGEMLLMGTWVTWSFIEFVHLPFWLAIILALIFSALLGIVIERFALRPMLGQSLMSMIMITIGIYSLLRGISLYFWGGPQQTFPQVFPSQGISVFGAPISAHLIIAAIIAVILVIFTYAYFQYTRGGLAMRATAENPMIAQSIGVNVTGAFSRSWALSSMVATMGGVLLGTAMGLSFGLSDIGLKSFPVVMLGGFESIPGVLIAGPIMGLCEFLGAQFLDPLVGGGIGEIIPFVVMLIVLLIKPYGLFGYKIIERV